MTIQQTNKLSLKELLLQRSREQADKLQSNLQEIDKIVEPVKLTLSQKLALAQSRDNASKLQVNTNIKVNDENDAMTLKSALLGISQGEKPILSQNQPIPTSTSLPVSTKKSLAEMIAARKATISVEDKLEEIAKTTEALKKELKVYTVEEAKAFATQVEDTNKPLTTEENIIDSNVKLKTLLSLKERLALKASNEVTKGNIEIVKGITTEIPKELLPKQSILPTMASTETFSLNIVLNDKQRAAVTFAESGRSFVLLGAAGTGKTSSEREILHALLAHNKVSTCTFRKDGGKHEAPSVAVCAYTRRAAANSAKAILKDPLLNERLPANIMTIHNLLEFVPEVYMDIVTDTEKFRFAPTRNRANPLTITHLIVEEATLVGLDLWEQLYEALPYDVQIIFVGDINQLPPVFGPSILNYALTKIPVVELTQVYRQAEGSPIINNAHRILRGEFLEEGKNEQGSLSIISGKRDVKVGQARSAHAIANLFKQFYEDGTYNPEEDMILSPWNKQELGTDAMNNHIAEFLSIKNNMLVYEIIAGFSKRYLAEGDKVICNKRDAIIVSIERNPAYVGKEPRLAGTDLSRYGTRRTSKGEDIASVFDEEKTVGDYGNFSIENLEETAGDRKMQASHKVTIAYEDGYTDTLTSASDLQFNSFSLGYAMTVHKSQGSEWRKVFCIFHPDHAINLSREMLYTAITRAREHVYLIAKKYVVDNAVTSQRIKGNTLEDKIALFNSGVKEILAHIRVTKPSIENR